MPHQAMGSQRVPEAVHASRRLLLFYLFCWECTKKHFTSVYRISNGDPFAHPLIKSKNKLAMKQNYFTAHRVVNPFFNVSLVRFSEHFSVRIKLEDGAGADNARHRLPERPDVPTHFRQPLSVLTIDELFHNTLFSSIATLKESCVVIQGHQNQVVTFYTSVHPRTLSVCRNSITRHSLNCLRYTLRVLSLYYLFPIFMKMLSLHMYIDLMTHNMHALLV